MPHLPEDIGEEALDNLIYLSRVIQEPQLETICINVMNDAESLNPSLGLFRNDETAKKLKDMFLNNETLADIVFNVEGRLSLLYIVF